MDPINNYLSPSKYVISRDAIDLNYIPTINRYKGSEVTQIWTKGKDNEYFEFEIKEKELKDKDGESTNVSYTLIACHICNIDVPKQYLKDHCNSKKHKIFKKIINIGLDRLKKVMNDEQVFDDSNKSDSVYFCSSCVTVVKMNEKILHHKSTTHKNSLMVDKILNDFLDLYENDEKTFMNETPVDNSSSQINNVVSWNSENNPLDDNRKVNDIIKLKEDSLDYSNKSIGNKIDKDNNKITPAILELPPTEKNLQAYVDFLISTKYLKDIKVLQNNNLQIKTGSGVKVKILEHHFNSLEKESKHIYRCILCRTNINKNWKWDHLYEKKHVDLVTIPFENENCFRQVDTWSHCALCNVSIQNHEEHILSDKDHKLNLNDALQTNIANISTEALNGNQSNNLNALMCKDDDVQVASTSKHNNTEMERKNQITVNNVERSNIPKSFFSIKCSKTTSDDLKTHNKIHRIDEKIEKSEIHYLIGLSDSPSKDFICKVCKTLISNNNIKVKEHMNSVHHNESYKKLLSVNNIKEFNKYLFHCQSCDVCFVKTTELIHINNKEHLQNLLPRVNIQTKQIANATPLPDMVLLKIDNNLVKDNVFRCYICNMSTENRNYYNIYSHLTTAVHIEAATKLTCDEVTNMHYHIDLTNFPILSCMVCDVSLTLNEENIITHVNGYIHKQNYKLKLRDNEIVIEKNVYSCKICSVSLNPMHELVHCKTKKHIEKFNEVNKNIEKPCDDVEITSKISPSTSLPPSPTPTLTPYPTPSPTSSLTPTPSLSSLSSSSQQMTANATPLPDMVLLKIDNNLIKDNVFRCYICNMSIESRNYYNIYSHLTTAVHIEAATKLTCDEVTNIHYHIDLKNFPILSCMVCDVSLTLNKKNINTHVNGYIHKQKYKLKLRDNKIVIENNVYSCKICSVSLIPMHELVHCKTKKHIEKLNKVIEDKDKHCDADADAGSTSKVNNQAKTDLNLPVKTYLFTKIGNHKELFCLVCNAKVPDNINNITTHLNCSAHRQLYRSTLEDNSIFNCCGDFECKLCHVVIATGNEFQHISTKAHQDNIKNSLKYNCVVCKVKLTNNDENIRLHNNGEQHKKIMELAFKNDIRIYGDKCFCETCEKVLENESINEHLKNSIHIMGAFIKDK